MCISGWFYLHENGELIYKPDYDGAVADLRESPFVCSIWPCDPTERELAWNVLVESLAMGAREGLVLELAAKWGCNDGDAAFYADRVKCILKKDGDLFAASREDFVNVQESVCGFGTTALHAMAALAKALGIRPQKMWGAGFRDLLKVSN